MEPHIYFPTWIDQLRGVAWQGGIGVVYTTDGGVTWGVTTSGVSVGFYGIVTVTIGPDSLSVTDGGFPVYGLLGWRWRYAEGDLAVANVNVEYSYTLVDELGIKASTMLNGIAADTATAAQLGTNWTTLGAALDAVTGAQILKGTIRISKPAAGGWKSSPASGSRVEQTAVFNQSVAENTHRWGIDIPAILSSKLTDGKVNLADTDITTLVHLLDGTTALTVGDLANVAYQVVTGLIDVITSFRKHRKLLGRATFESAA